jgi:hypothetical protein
MESYFPPTTNNTLLWNGITGSFDENARAPEAPGGGIGWVLGGSSLNAIDNLNGIQWAFQAASMVMGFLQGGGTVDWGTFFKGAGTFLLGEGMMTLGGQLAVDSAGGGAIAVAGGQLEVTAAGAIGMTVGVTIGTAGVALAHDGLIMMSEAAKGGGGSESLRVGYAGTHRTGYGEPRRQDRRPGNTGERQHDRRREGAWFSTILSRDAHRGASEPDPSPARRRHEHRRRIRAM